MDDLPDIKISPLEGTPFLKGASMAFIFFLLLAFYIGGIIGILFWIAVVIVSILILSILYGRLSANWRKIHYPMMVRYAAALGFAHGLSEKNGTKFDIKMALELLFHSLFPEIQESQTEEFVQEILTREEKIIKDEKIIEKIFMKKHPKLENEKLRVLASKYINLITNPPDEATSNYLKVRSFIAFLVEKKYGSEEKLNYLYEVLTNKAS